MARSLRTLIASAALGAAIVLGALVVHGAPASAQGLLPSPTPSPTPDTCYTGCEGPGLLPSPTPSPTPATCYGTECPVTFGPAYAPPTDGGSSGDSVRDVANQRFNQMITNRVLGTVLLGVNEQVNCGDCMSAFGSVGSFSAGIHGRKEITNNLSLIAGLAYTHYGEGNYSVTSAPIGAFALRYDFTDWGSSRPFFDIGTILTPWEKVRYTRSYNTNSGPVTVAGSTNSSNYAVYGRAGWITRLSPRDEVAGSVEFWQLWQRVSGYSDPTIAYNPFEATFATGTDRTSLVKIGGQWTHLFGRSVEANINGGYVHSFGSNSGILANITSMNGTNSVTATMGDQGWFELGGRLGFRVSESWIVDLFANGTVGPHPVGNTVHGGIGLRIKY
ncbi:MAG: hypothetical protein HY852_04830 [Bradyrhizobium sp.]|uniref:hypothetical protein n=1 Tax=Bradyrhizobium sp. TaxID=376 RepID=UPI0025C497D3|nr:hypothetical protein [Bradyrhizobium sp.]MBI5261125.1 hypothetical protein [Bradyrhizobium sp.]